MQTVNEARYTFWHTVIDLWQASDKPKDEWCWENKLPLKTFVHYEGIFRRQKARGYVYGKMDRMDSNKEPLEQGRTGIPVKDDSGNSDRPQKSSAASAYVEIPMPGAECQEPVTKPSDPRMPGKKRIPASREKTVNRPEDSRLVIQAGGCRLSVGGDVSEMMLRSILKAVSADD